MKDPSTNGARKILFPFQNIKSRHYFRPYINTN